MLQSTRSVLIKAQTEKKEKKKKNQTNQKQAGAVIF